MIARLIVPRLDGGVDFAFDAAIERIWERFDEQQPGRVAHEIGVTALNSDTTRGGPSVYFCDAEIE
ncbi:MULTISPECIES: hypothetical protein [Rhizobium]|uniref:Uncharacterized protein n=1 Tax=Rhizobium paranaense TaxID=1650438 RepID=A0A7W8XY28_9HYPH|nr:hypothetical protein [Rhizobium paranaense]MBB5577694.1 hypothetical protein [Rhizobium paranaense]